MKEEINKYAKQGKWNTIIKKICSDNEGYGKAYNEWKNEKAFITNEEFEMLKCNIKKISIQDIKNSKYLKIVLFALCLLICMVLTILVKI